MQRSIHAVVRLAAALGLAGAAAGVATGPAGAAKVTLAGKPTAVYAYPSDGGAKVRWTPPVAVAGGITAYRASLAPGGATCTTAGATTCQVAGLTDGTAYRVTVAAEASTGWGKSSKAVKVTPSAAECTAVIAGANLQGCDLAHRDLHRARLTRGTNVRLTNLTGAVLGPVIAATGRRFVPATIGGANLAGADLDGVVSGGIVGDPAELPTGWIVANGYLVGPGADLTGADLAGADLTGAYLDGTILTGADVDGTVFPRDEPVPGYPNIDFTGIVSGGLIGTPALLPAGNELLNGYLVGPGAELAGADLAGVTLVRPATDDEGVLGADLAGADLAGADLRGASGSWIDFTLTRFVGADLRDTDFPDAWFKPASGYVPGTMTHECYDGYTELGGDWTGTVLTDAQFGCVDFSGADMTGADLTGADSGSGEDFNTVEGTGGNIGTPVALPSGWRLVDGDLIGPGGHIAELDLSGADLRGVDLSGATVVIVTMAGADLSGADLAGAALDGVQFDGADLTGADFSGVTIGTAQSTWTTTFLGAVWSDTTCPDGTNSDADGGTCANDLG